MIFEIVKKFKKQIAVAGCLLVVLIVIIAVVISGRDDDLTYSSGGGRNLSPSVGEEETQSETTITDYVYEETTNLSDEQLLETVNSYIMAGDYEAALKETSALLYVVSDTAPLYEIFNEISPIYSDRVLAEANAFLANNDFKSALDTLNNGLNTFSGFSFDTTINEKKYSESLNKKADEIAAKVVSKGQNEALLSADRGDYVGASASLVPYISMLSEEQAKPLSDMKKFYDQTANLEVMVKYANRFFTIDGAYGVIKPDGSLWTWGNNSHGLLGDGSKQNSDEPKKIMDNVISVSSVLCSYSNYYPAVVVLKADGTLWSWGTGGSNANGDGTFLDRTEPKQIMSDVIYVTDLYYIKSNGDLYVWGQKTEDKSTHLFVDSGVVYVDSVSNSYIKEDGSLWAITMNERLNIVTSDRQRILDNVNKVSNYGVLKNDGTLWYWFRDKQPKKIADDIVDIGGHELYINSDNIISKYVYGSSEEFYIDDVSGGAVEIMPQNDFYINTDGDLYAVKYDASIMTPPYSSEFFISGIMIERSITPYLTYKLPEAEKSSEEVFRHTIFAEGKTTAVIKTDNSLYMWGDTYSGKTTTPQRTYDNVKDVGLGDDSALLTDDGKLYTWNAQNTSPKFISQDVLSVSSDGSSYVKTDGSVWYSSDEKAVEDSVYVDIEKYYALREDRSLWYYPSKQNATKVNDDVVSFCVSDETESNGSYDQYNVYVTADGTLIIYGEIWGKNNATYTNTDATIVSYNGSTGAYIDSNGKLWTWGEGSNGEIGNNFSLPITFENRFNVLSDVVDVAVGENYIIALKSDGSLWAWGNNSYGQLGDGTTENSLVPKKIMDGVKLP